VAGVKWSDEIDGVLDGDLTAGLAYVTPAGGAVVTAVAPLGLRDRAAGRVTFTTSLGFGRKLERIEHDPRIALAYHAREHGFSDSPRFVLLQGRAAPVLEPDSAVLESVVAPAAERFMGPPARGRFWDRWLQEYYADRVLVHVDIERVVAWPDLLCRGEPEVTGTPLPAQPPAPQAPPANGTGPRMGVERAARRLGKLPHRLLAWRDADGFPTVVPFGLGATEAEGVRISSPAGPLPPEGRRAGVLAHRYNARLVGLEARQHTGWLAAGMGGARGLYAPHTQSGFRAPASKPLLLLGNGLLAKRGLRRARRAGRA